jgi:hypothetical protein
VDQDENASIWWAEDEILKTNTVLKNSRSLYFDTYGSFYNLINCYNPKNNTVPLFKEVTEKGTRYFYLIEKKDKIVIPYYLKWKSK